MHHVRCESSLARRHVQTPPYQSPWCLLKFAREFILFSCMAGPAPDGFGVPMSRRMPSRDVVPTRREVLRHSGMQWPQEIMYKFLLPPIGGWNDLPYLTLP